MTLEDDVNFFLGNFPDMKIMVSDALGLLVPHTTRERRDAIEDAIQRNKWDKENYEKINKAFQRFREAYALSGLNQNLGLFLRQAELYAEQSDGTVSINIGSTSANADVIYQIRNRVFPHEIAHFILDEAIGLIGHTPGDFSGFLSSIFENGINGKLLHVPNFNVGRFANYSSFATPALLNNLRELVVDAIGYQLAINYIDKEQPEEGLSNEQIYLQIYNHLMHQKLEPLRKSVKRLSQSDVDNNDMLPFCRYEAIHLVNAERAKMAGLTELSEDSSKLAKEFRELMESSVIGAIGNLKLYRNLLIHFMETYKKINIHLN